MTARPIKIAVMALGGQGGGVLASWLVKAGERAGYIAQATSVPGVAQRTGATIYYVELFPEAEAKGRAPVLALSPAPGDVDIVIASEMMEAGRALIRGFVAAGTTLIASTHRVYAIGEKVALGEGRQSTDEVCRAAEAAAGRCLWLDMERAADEAGAAISAVMLGALAGSGATAIPRAVFEAVIRDGGRAVERNLDGFARGFEMAAAAAPAPSLASAAATKPRATPSRALAPLLARVEKLPAAVQAIARLGLERVVDFQDARYGALFLDRLERFVALDNERRAWRLSNAVARHLALWMAYDDVIRVADLKTRRDRFERVRADVRAAPRQIVRVREYMHPRVEEFCDLLPPALARLVLRSPAARRAVGAVLGGGRRVETTALHGFLLLNALASLRGIRRSTYRYRIEQARIAEWLAAVEQRARTDYALACELAGLQRLIKGYGETHGRGLERFRAILGAVDVVAAQAAPATALAKLRESALKDESGAALESALRDVSSRPAEFSPAAE